MNDRGKGKEDDRVEGKKEKLRIRKKETVREKERSGKELGKIKRIKERRECMKRNIQVK